jgi:hypothetical protein
MIYEYAFEPELIIDLAKKKDRLPAKYIIESFGLGKPRLLSEFPKKKKWRKLFFQAHNSDELNDTNKKRLEEIYQILTERMINRCNSYCFNGEVSWLNNALMADKIKPFRAIIFRANLQRKNILCLEEMGDWPNDFWSADSSYQIKKKAEVFAATLAPFLHNSKKFFLIDPYFSANKKMWQKPLKMMLQEFVKYKDSQEKFCIEIHISGGDKRKETNDYIKKVFMDHRFKQILPQNIGLKVKRWRQIPDEERYHDRFLFTDIGGVRSSAGFDEITGATTGLEILTGKAYAIVYRKYLGENPEFELECEFTVS